MPIEIVDLPIKKWCFSIVFCMFTRPGIINPAVIRVIRLQLIASLRKQKAPPSPSILPPYPHGYPLVMSK